MYVACIGGLQHPDQASILTGSLACFVLWVATDLYPLLCTPYGTQKNQYLFACTYLWLAGCTLLISGDRIINFICGVVLSSVALREKKKDFLLAMCG